MPERQPPPPDQMERKRALDPTGSFLVQAPAGCGKTYLLTQRFLRLLAQAEKPEEIVAITFTKAAATEMRNRVLEALEDAESNSSENDAPDSLHALAKEALQRARLLNWRILDLPGQLRITTIDSFCRSLALQSPLSWGLLSGLGGKLDQVEHPEGLYRRAASRTLDLLRQPSSPIRESVEKLLLWRDNNWSDVETLIVEMLQNRNRWFQDFVFSSDADWTALRSRLEAPFRRAARARLETLCRILNRLEGSCDFALQIARLACHTPGKSSPFSLAERAALPLIFAESENEALMLEDATDAYSDLADFLLTAKGEWRKKTGLNVNHGFPTTPDGRRAKDQFGEFVEGLALEPGLPAGLAAFQKSIPVRYTGDEWEIIRHCFAVLRHAAGQLQVVFAETGSVDFTEVAQIALRILAPENGFPSDPAMRQADGIRHLLIDEFQDTSRSQHQLLARLIAAWPDRHGRSCFCVGDPMQSIYGFRDAEVELFERLKTHGLETSTDLMEGSFPFDFVTLRANFRTTPSLVHDLNRHFEHIFFEDDGSNIRFSAAEPARELGSTAVAQLHLAFTQSSKPKSGAPDYGDPETTFQSQLEATIALIQSKLAEAASARKAAPEAKFRIAVLGRTRSSLTPIAQGLMKAGIPFRALDLVKLRERPEVLDVLALARALLNPIDRTAWLGTLRAPWCGLSLDELHLLTSADNPEVVATPIPTLLEARLPELFANRQLDSRACAAASRVARVLRTATETRGTAASAALGTWLESIWKALGGVNTLTAEQHENLRLLWSTLDALPESDLDLLSPTLDAALDQLFALPDPAASGDFGVQLMTIHKSKGLEFEVVIIPDLESATRSSVPTMISWLERAIAEANPEHDDEHLTEFLIAPIQPKGGDRGAAQSWVESVKRGRETQEMRRLLYVAATRAREELHLFARPRFNFDKSGNATLSKPSGLLSTAWPALGQQIQARFDDWAGAATAAKEPEPSFELDTLAAQASGNLLQMPVTLQSKPTLLRRLPETYTAPEFPSKSASARFSNPGDDHQSLYARTEGGLQSRLLGKAIHSLLEELTRLRRTLTPVEAAAALSQSLRSITAEIRGQGLPGPSAERLAAQALKATQDASISLIGAWILAPHPHAEAEARWTALIDGPASGANAPLRNLRPDRVFLAPGPEGEIKQAWWILDYKTSHASAEAVAGEAGKQAFLIAHRQQHQEQLAVYAEAFRQLRRPEPSTQIRAGIFYPRLLLFDSWSA